MKKNLIILALIVCVCGTIYADEIVENAVIKLKTGEEIIGNITGKDAVELFVQSNGVNITYPLAEIQEINRADKKERHNIIIKGNVIFDEYVEGTIVVGASRIQKFLEGCIITTQVLERPGPYELVMPSCPDKVWVKAFNSVNSSGHKLENDVEFKYKNNPVIIDSDSAVLTGIDLYVKKLKR